MLWYSLGVPLVPRAVSAGLSGQSKSQLPKTFEKLGAKLPPQTKPETQKKARFVQGILKHQIFPKHRARLGGSRLASLPPRLQHAEPTDPSQELELPTLGLQLQPETRQNTDHKRKKKVEIWKCISPLQRDSAAHQAHRWLTRTIQTWQYWGFLAGRWPAIHICARRLAHWHVQVQIPAHEIGENDKRFEALDILSI